MVDLAQTIEEWKDIQSIKVDDQVDADNISNDQPSYLSVVPG